MLTHELYHKETLKPVVCPQTNHKVHIIWCSKRKISNHRHKSSNPFHQIYSKSKKQKKKKQFKSKNYLIYNLQKNTSFTIKIDIFFFRKKRNKQTT